MQIRVARPGDHAAIASFTQDTFSWGDYVADRFPEWLDDPDSEVFVAADDAVAVALVRVELLSPDEAWLASARVAPSYRGRGLATELNRLCMQWALDRGALVGRLAVEDWNEPARRQVLRLGFRSVSTWSSSEWKPGSGGPGTSQPRSSLEATNEADVEAAYGAWATGDLAKAAHDLFPIGWTWRRMRIDDIRNAARRGHLLAGPDGWIVAEPKGEEATLWVPWLQTGHTGAPGLTSALLARAGDADEVHVMVPSVPWLDEALARGGFDLNPIQIYEKETSPTT